MLVYVPNTSEVNPLETLRRVGLYELHDDGLGCMGAAVNAHGPDGGGGALIGWPGRGETLAMNLERQEWHAVKPHGDLAAGRAWIGWDKSNPPGPETLRRQKQLGGDLLRLADGCDWLVPVASQAPKKMGIDDLGHVAAVMAPQYQPFFQMAFDALASYVQSNGTVLCPYEESFDVCVRILAMNYRMTRDLANALGLIDSRSLWTIPATTIEAAALVDLTQKKRTPESDSITSGVTA